MDKTQCEREHLTIGEWSAFIIASVVTGVLPLVAALVSDASPLVIVAASVWTGAWAMVAGLSIGCLLLQHCGHTPADEPTEAEWSDVDEPASNLPARQITSMRDLAGMPPLVKR